LKIIADTTEIVAFPSLVSNVPEKWANLITLFAPLKPMILKPVYKKLYYSNTILLPLYNGVDATERIQKLFSENTV
jgi:2-dehydropantoate 2-reductase